MATTKKNRGKDMKMKGLLFVLLTLCFFTKGLIASDLTFNAVRSNDFYSTSLEFTDKRVSDQIDYNFLGKYNNTNAGRLYKFVYNVDYDFDRLWDCFLDVLYDHNTIIGIDNRIGVAAGVGYYLAKEANYRIKVSDAILLQENKLRNSFRLKGIYESLFIDASGILTVILPDYEMEINLDADFRVLPEFMDNLFFNLSYDLIVKDDAPQYELISTGLKIKF